MANLIHANPDQAYAYNGHWWHDLNVYINSQDTNANTSNVTIEIVVYSDGSAYTQSGTWVGQIWVNGSLVQNTSSSRSVSNSGQQIAVWNGTIGHDANGNASPYIEYYVNEPATSMSRRGANWGIPRIPLAPSILAIVADTIKQKTSRLGIEINNNGHGTSSSMHMGYRVQGSPSWTYTADQADVAGYNYWSLSGLNPNTTYEYYGTVWNNNGDTSNSGTQTFKTKANSGIIFLMGGLA